MNSPLKNSTSQMTIMTVEESPDHSPSSVSLTLVPSEPSCATLINEDKSQLINNNMVN